MSKDEIVNLLKEVYPQYLTPREIQEKIEISRNRVFRLLRNLKKRDDIQFITKRIPNSEKRWETSYRVNKKFL